MNEMKRQIEQEQKVDSMKESIGSKVSGMISDEQQKQSLDEIKRVKEEEQKKLEELIKK